MTQPAFLIAIVAATALVALFVWLWRAHRRTSLWIAAVALIPGGISGALILRLSNQTGMDSIQGFLLSLLVGTVVLVILIAAALRSQWRASALSVAVSLVLSAVMISQLLVALRVT